MRNTLAAFRQRVSWREGSLRNFYVEMINGAPQGLYRVWVRADAREGSPLVARWIDPRAAENGSRADDNLPICEEIRLIEEASEIEADPGLPFAFAGAF